MPRYASSGFAALQNPLEKSIRDHEARYHRPRSVIHEDNGKTLVSITVPVLYLISPVKTNWFSRLINWLLEADSSYSASKHQQIIASSLLTDGKPAVVTVEKTKSSGTRVRGYDNLAIQNVRITLSVDEKADAETVIQQLELAASLSLSRKIPLPNAAEISRSKIGKSPQYNWGSLRAKVAIEQPTLPSSLGALLNIPAAPLGILAGGIKTCFGGSTASCCAGPSSIVGEELQVMQYTKDGKYLLTGSRESPCFFRTRAIMSGPGTIAPKELNQMSADSRGQGGFINAIDYPERLREPLGPPTIQMK